MTLKISTLLMLALFLSSCLKTRADISGQDQEALYGKKNAENQVQAQADPSEPAPAPAVSQSETVAQASPLDEKDELIRSLTGRLETLENQMTTLQKEKETLSAENAQKMVLLQEALTKLELQVQKLEVDSPIVKTTDKVLKNIEDSEQVTAKADGRKLSTYEVAEQYFVKEDWKKAILNFQKYTDEKPKAKNVADAKYKIGICFQELGMKEEAMAFYEEVVANYPKTEAGKKSKTRLDKLKK